MRHRWIDRIGELHHSTLRNCEVPSDLTIAPFFLSHWPDLLYAQLEHSRCLAASIKCKGRQSFPIASLRVMFDTLRSRLLNVRAMQVTITARALCNALCIVDVLDMRVRGTE